MTRNLIGLVADNFPLSASNASRSLVAKGLAMPGPFEEQKVRIMLWLVICGVLRTNRGSYVLTNYLIPLEHLSEVSTIDCAKLCYYSLLSCLRTTCRRLRDGDLVSLFSPWRLFKVRSDTLPVFYLLSWLGLM